MREDVIDFFRLANTNFQIWSQLEKGSTPPEIVKVAAGHGYNLTVSDIIELGRAIDSAPHEVADEQIEAVGSAPARRRTSFRLIAAGVLATSNVCTKNSPVTCVTLPVTMAGDTCNCTVFQKGCK